MKIPADAQENDFRLIVPPFEWRWVMFHKGVLKRSQIKKRSDYRRESISCNTALITVSNDFFSACPYYRLEESG
jgi:hypothetical protein